MQSALDIALYFLYRVDREAGDTISALKLQKLVYYAQVWSMVLRGHPLFQQPVEAWKHGPVVRELWEDYKDYRYEAIPTPTAEPPSFAPAELEILDFVWVRYGELSAHQLRELTHSEPPWQNTRGDLSLDEASNRIIALEDMKTFHVAESPWGEITPESQRIWEALVYELLCRPEEFKVGLDPNLESLKNALLDAIERAHADYASAMTDALSEAMTIPNETPSMDADDFREWLSQV
ncbi:MAG: type II toxin-antitoxin system antitoxin SocA domain-containing protein [Cyanobacteria bacterium P01_F01_bin.86]